MSKPAVTDFFMYRWRYRLSYAFIALALSALLFVTGMFAPGGLSEVEMNSIVRSATLDKSVLTGQRPEQILYLPYDALQAASIQIFGMSILSLKLPSLVFAGLSVAFFYGIVRLWFRRNVAVVATLILATSGQFLFQSQQATPVISLLFWGTALLFSASMIARARTWQPAWLIFTGAIAGLSLYNAYLVYLVAVLIFTSLVHPHARFVIFKQPLWAKLSAVFCGVILGMPIILTIFYHPSILLALLAVPDESLSEIIKLSSERGLKYLDFMHPENGSFLAPAYGLGTFCLAILGAIQLITTKYTAKSYIITIWFGLSLLVVALNPLTIGLTLLPIMLLVAFGIDYLIRSWYRLFPRNPYARFIGLLPLTVLIFGILFSNVERFTYGYHYSKTASSVYKNDLTLLDSALQKYKNSTITLVVNNNSTDFYTMYADQNNYDIVTSSIRDNKRDVTIVINPSNATNADDIPTKIVTSSVFERSNRLYIYENTSK